jgi:DNA-binding LytR/AlgR family response regulator
MMIRCIIIDDEQHAVDLLTSHIHKLPLLNLSFATTDPVAAFQYVQQNEPELIFLDIQMAELNGIQFLKLLRGRSKVILTTAYPEFALEGYEHDIIDYLLKPILFDRFLKAVNKTFDRIHRPSSINADHPADTSGNEDHIFVKTGSRNKIVRILLHEIEYVESKGNYVAIHTINSHIITQLTMKELEEKLPVKRFRRIHNSYLVPLNKITAVEGNQLQIGKHKLPIGDTYKKAFLQAINGKIIMARKNN